MEPIDNTPEAPVATAAPNCAAEAAPEATPPAAPAWPWICLLAAILFAVTAAVFSPSIDNELLPWDDQHNIQANPLLNPPSVENLVRLWTAPYDRLYVPLFYTSFFADLWVAPGKAWPFHAGNVLIHAVTTVLVFLLLLGMTKHAAPGGVKPGHVLTASFVGALLFGIHPIQAECVSWATGRKDLLSGLFAVAAMLNYLHFAGGRGGGAGRALRYVLAIVCTVLSLLAKPAAVAIPVACLAIDFFLVRRSAWRALVSLLPFFALCAAWALASMRIQSSTPQLAAALPPAWTRPMVAADAIVFYLWKIVYPMDLAPVYGRVPWEAINSSLFYVALPATACAVLLIMMRRTVWAAATGIFLAFLLPVLGLVPFDYQLNSTVADRYVYVSMAGIALACAAAVRAACAAGATAGGTVTAAALLIAAAFASLSVSQCQVWLNSETLWLHSLRVAPHSPVVQNSAGMVYGQLALPEEAEKAFREAVRLRPGFAPALTNLGNVLSQSGREQEAIEQYRMAVEAEPGFLIAHTNLAMSHLKLSQNDDAASAARVALKLNPAFMPALDCLVQALGPQGKIAQAAPELREALKADPSNELVRGLLQRIEGPDKP